VTGADLSVSGSVTNSAILPSLMRMTEKRSARIFAGALLLCAAAPLSAERISLAAERADQACPSPALPFGVAPLPAAGAPAAGACLIHAPVPDLTDATLEDLDARLAPLGSAPAVDLDVNIAGVAASAPSAEGQKVRLLYAMKKLSSAARASLPGRKVLVSFSAIAETPRSEIERAAR